MTETMLPKLIQPSPWLAYRTYEHSGQWRSIILNECDHEMIILEGAASAMWGAIEGGVYSCDLSDLATKHGQAESELVDFIDELAMAGLLACEKMSEPVSAKPAPITKRLEFASNTDEEYAMIEWATNHGFLYSAQWEVTFRCNEACVHCYNPGAAHSPHERNERKRNELTTQEAKRMLDALVRCGVFRLILSGGEATLRRDFFEIFAYARKLGFAVALYTNGQTATDDFIEKLAKLWPTSVSISVYSANPSVHDEITRVPNSFAKSIEALKKFQARGIKTYIKSIQMSHTVSGFELVQDLATSLGAGAEVDMHFSDGADGARLTGSLSVDDPVTLVSMAMTPSSPMYVGDSKTNFGAIKKDRDSTVCGSGVSFMYIDPEGNFSPCSSMPIGAVNIRDGGLEDHWKQSPIGKQGPWSCDILQASGEPSEGTLNWWQGIRLRDYRECGTHRRCSWCTKCPGLAYLQYGDVLGPSTVNCRNAGARMIAADLLQAGVNRDAVIGSDAIGFGRSSGIRRLPLIIQQPHAERSITCATGSCSGCVTTSAVGGNSTYSSFYPGLELDSGPHEIVSALRELDRFTKKFVGVLPSNPVDLARRSIG